MGNHMSMSIDTTWFENTTPVLWEAAFLLDLLPDEIMSLIYTMWHCWKDFPCKEFHAFETPYSHILLALSGEIALYSMSSVVYLLTYYAREQ